MKAEQLQLTVILPVYNEAENIKALVEGVDKYLDDYKIYFIDDASKDGTAALIKKLSKSPRFVKHEVVIEGDTRIVRSSEASNFKAVENVVVNIYTGNISCTVSFFINKGAFLPGICAFRKTPS